MVAAAPADDSGDADQVETILRDVIAVLETDDDVPGRDEGGMLADMVVDGVRCTFQRVHVSAVDVLSPREREIARMVSQGYTNNEVGRQLFISRHTVAFHLKKVFQKMNITSRVELAAAWK